MITSLKKQIDFGIDTDVAFVLVTGKNFQVIQKLNSEHQFFKKLVPLEHPRFIVQYKQKFKKDYIAKYLEAFEEVRD
jgi:hypothetical protein